MLLERMLRHDDAKKPFVLSLVATCYLREIIRGRFDVGKLRTRFHMDATELAEFRQIFLEPFTTWTRADRIKATYMAEDLFRISDQEKRSGMPMTTKVFLELFHGWEPDTE